MSGPLHSALPEMLREMALECGLESVMCLIRWRGNQRLYIPKARVPDNHELVLRLGRCAADWLVSKTGSETLIVPRAVEMLREQRDGEIRERFNSGDSALALAMRYGLHERQIWRIVANCDRESDRSQARLL